MQCLYPFSLLFLMWLSVGGRAYAERSWADTEPLLWATLTVGDGLSSNTVRAICQDKYGRIWIGTGRGVDIYDGQRIVCHKIHNKNVGVHCLYETAERMWIGTDVGLFYLDFSTDSIHAFQEKTSQGVAPHSEIYDIQQDKERNIWFTTFRQGIFKWNQRAAKLTSHPLPKNEKRGCCLLVGNQGTVWAFTPWGNVHLCSFNHQVNQFEPYPLYVEGKSRHISGLTCVQDSKGNIYLGADDGNIYKFKSGSHEAQCVHLSDHIHGIYSLAFANSHELIVGTDNGLVIFDIQKENIKLIPSDRNVEGAPVHRYIYAVCIDKENTLWTGSYNGGICYTHQEYSNFISYNSRQLPPSTGCVISSFAEDKEGNIWIGSTDGNLAVFNPASHTVHQSPLAIGVKNVQDICIANDKLYIGTYLNGMAIANLKTGQTQFLPQLLSEEGTILETSAHCLLADDQGRVWIGTYDKICLHEEGKPHIEEEKGGTSLINQICKDSQERLWFATFQGGVFCYDKKRGKWKVHPVHVFDEASSYTCNAIYSDSEGRIWLGTNQGLFRYNEKKQEFEFEDTGLPSIPEILDITDVKGALWITSSAGLIHYLPTKHQIAQIYKAGGGIDNADFIQGAFFKSKNHQIYMGTSNGFTTFNPSQMMKNKVVPEVRFTEMDLYGKSIDVSSGKLKKPLIQTDTICLAYDENAIRIFFSAMSYVNPRNNQYRFYFEGFDKSWNEAGHQADATYTNLLPGTYAFHVQASNNDGVWSTEDAVLTIIITPPFYWNTPAKLLYLLLAISALILGIREILKRRERKHLAEIEEFNKQKEIDIHEARIQFMSMTEEDSQFLSKLEAIIETHFSNSNLSVDLIASEIGMSRSSLYARLKKLSDMTPNEMIQIVRLKHAEAMLTSGKYRVSEICYAVGFNSPSYFSKCFQKRYGKAPAEYFRKESPELG
ncbi:MAG: helix-turn-helix domain-containing protein [Bacteroidaceae bacterium]|nr:helix-turn-helix domain-containing protein [Bacteroidaceae bacterium]